MKPPSGSCPSWAGSLRNMVHLCSENNIFWTAEAFVITPLTGWTPSVCPHPCVDLTAAWAL
eukprot:1087568-Prorocentrum_lima.AAC.1